MTLLRHEMKMNLKSLLIFTLCVGFTCFGCILLYYSIEDSMSGMSEMFAQMGGFSAALGMDRISISTMEGYYATEISLIFAVGGAMFAAMTGAAALSKEEEGHTSEFLNTLPFGRGYIVLWKYLAVVLLLLLFEAICICWCGLGLAVLLYVMDLMCRVIPDIEFLKYVTPYYFSNATDIFVESAVNSRMMGISIGVTIASTLLAAWIYRKRDLAA